MDEIAEVSEVSLGLIKKQGLLSSTENRLAPHTEQILPEWAAYKLERRANRLKVQSEIDRCVDDFN